MGFPRKHIPRAYVNEAIIDTWDMSRKSMNISLESEETRRSEDDAGKCRFGENRLLVPPQYDYESAKR